MNESTKGLLEEIVRTGPAVVVIGWFVVAIAHFGVLPDVFILFVISLTVIYVTLLVAYIVLIELNMDGGSNDE